MVEELKKKINSYLLFKEELSDEDFRDILDILDEKEDEENSTEEYERRLEILYSDFEDIIDEIEDSINSDYITDDLKELKDSLKHKHYWR